MSRRLYRGTRYLVLGIVSFILLINLVSILEDYSINCEMGIVSCSTLVDLLLYVSYVLIFVGVIKLYIFLWKEYKIVDKYREFEVKYLNKKPKTKTEEKIKGKCGMCGTMNDSDAVFCKKCAASIVDAEENSTPTTSPE